MNPAPIHGGHRTRLRARFQAEGFSSFQPHEVLEMLLYTTIPQRDVNPLAHALIDHFGSVAQVLTACEAELTRIPGIGERTARWLISLGQATEYYASLSLQDRPLMNSASKLRAYCASLIDQPDEPQTWVLSMNLSARLYNGTCIARGESARTLSLRPIIEPALRYHARAITLVQNRPTSEVRISPEDVAFTDRLASQLSGLRILMLDHLYISDSKALSMRQEKLYQIERYLDVERSGEVRELCVHWLDSQ